ncbi:Malate/lactate/ureidoglycolate dehydrogenase, LDH2 family [Halanaeroarchaeum sp. HSR-CO]|uniref:Ldh family oxidoreductase n=1 Tax=Halanaeroarchaeum sp. HSR-CO TaxID=2866382 RepID=UPI00217E945A|nr:Ldh family oxidoreductase [Halanaeroarchaeum sp. HSR-CO]UWG46339.1 Malate/lactate/ureidoglycolate dehydrogenase, LDH2 family [Halanaeroarchaeum sp. HSR-CO]
MVRVSVPSLKDFTETLLRELGTHPDIAPKVAAILVNADTSGHSSHGVRQIVSKYATEITTGRIDPGSVPTVADEDDAWATIDGNLAFGQAVGALAVEIGVEKARNRGVGLVGLKRTSHIGRVGEFAEQACEAGMGFVAFVSNPGSAYVAPPGSAQRRFSTNPISIGIPTFSALEFPLTADLSTGQVAHGKIKERAVNDDRLPEDWVVDSSGESLRDGAAFEREGVGAIRPLGGETAGHKGFALGVLSELLAASVSDGSVSGMADVLWGNHAAFFVVDVTEFSTRSRIEERASAMAAYVRETDYDPEIGVGTAARGETTLLPGEAEFRSTRRSLERGVSVSPADARDLAALADSLGIDSSTVPDSFVDG